ncbi:MAG: hypothetical protein IJT12_03840 [Paludibacteraceae bacterium]|nr:hypothetical protein [Paludibacteraceae bacterium]
MAKVELSPLIKSMSGTIARRKLSDGTTVTYVVTKKNRLYIHSSRPRVTPLSEREIRQRQRFGIIASAVQLVRSRLNLPSDPKTQKQLWSGLGVHYDAMRQNGKTLTAEKLADSYCMLVM